jgi:hypothetical protein
VGTLTFTLVLLESVTGSFVPQLSVLVAGGLVLVSVVTFLLLIGRISRILRPGPMAARILATAGALEGGELGVVTHAGACGVIQAVDVAGLVGESQRGGAPARPALARLGRLTRPGLTEIVRYGAGAP